MSAKTKPNPRKETRPWGRYDVLLREPGVQVKRIELNPRSRFSLQKHDRRSEKWVVIAGEGAATVEQKVLPVRPGTFVDIPRGCIHRLTNKGPKPLVIIEVQFGKYLGEDDVVRYEDDFGRCESAGAWTKSD